MAKGIVLAFLAFAVFAWGDAVVKEIGYGLDPFEVTFFGYLIPFLLSPVFMKPGDRLIDIVRWNRPWLPGERRCRPTLRLPADCPAIVTFPGSPPNAPM